MPRGRSHQLDEQANPRTQRVARLRKTPPNSRVSQNGITESTAETINGASSSVNLGNSTLTGTQTPEMSSSQFTPLLVGAVAGIANNTSSVELEENAALVKVDVTSIQTQTENAIRILSPEEEVRNFGSSGHFPSILSSLNKAQIINPEDGLTKNQQRPVYFHSLLSNLGKKVDGLPIMDSSAFSLSWIQTFEKAGLLKEVAAAEGLTEDSSKNFTDDMKKLRDELDREKAARILMEQQLIHERQERERVEQELDNTVTAKEELQQTLRTTEQRNNELQATLATVQQALEEYHNSSGSSDWILYRDEILLSDKVVGVGGWGKVVEGKFRGCKVAVKQIHELILSPHNRRLFEREMSIASRCRHPCLLQFIGATNDDQSPLFVTELLDTSLRAVLHERALQPSEISTIALDVAKGLNYLHLNHPAPIIHRDISSANVLLWKHDIRWRAKVSDYGTANFMQYSMTVSPGAVVYSAPEAQTSRQSPKVDTYSFGVLLCEMNIREFPDISHRKEQVAMVTNQFLRDLIGRCLKHDPEKRPDVTEIINLLENQK